MSPGRRDLPASVRFSVLTGPFALIGFSVLRNQFALHRRSPVIFRHTDAGWSSSVARWAHNPEVAGSNPVPATNEGPDLPEIRALASLTPDAPIAAVPHGAGSAVRAHRHKPRYACQCG